MTSVPGRHWLNDHSLGRIVMALWDSVMYGVVTSVTRIPSHSKGIVVALLTFAVVVTGVLQLATSNETSLPVKKPPMIEQKLPAFVAKPSWVPDKASLKGGKLTKPRQAFDYAVARKLTFVKDEATVQKLVAAGTLVPLDREHVGLVDVSVPYVLPATRDFVRRLAKQYKKAQCGKLIVTSALRLTKKQPSNASSYSVHPTGMAVDFRVPKDTRCREWVTNTLLQIESTKRIDATQEKNPPHFHVVVVSDAYEHWLKRLLTEVTIKNKI